MQQSAEIKVGIFVVVAVALGVFIVANLQGLTKPGYEFEIWFSDAPGVGKGSPVRQSGVDIGRVVDKDIVTVTEGVEVNVNDRPGLLPFVRVTRWSHGTQQAHDEVSIAVGRKPLTAAQARAVQPFQRERSVARLKVRIDDQYNVYQKFGYKITGGIVFGDKQLEITDIGSDGFPMSESERGDSVRAKCERRQRVAVLGVAPPNVDKIVSNVEDVVDEETVERSKQIVAHIEKMTDQAAELVTALRETVDANQGNIDRMLANASNASEDLRAGIAEARVLASQTMQNVERLSGVGRRVAEGNEAKLNRIASDVQETSSTLARTMRRSESKVDQTVTDVAAIAREVREMIASNREHLDNVAEKLSATSSDVAAMTGDAKDKVASILTSVDQSVGQVRDLLQESDAKFTAMVDNSNALVADARATVGTVRESIEPITANLTETSAHIKDASRNVADLTGDPSTKQILNNAERVTAEARELLADVRSITADPTVQEDLKVTAHNLRSATEGVTNTFGRLKDVKPYVNAEVYYIPDNSLWRADLNGNLALGSKNSLHFGVDNITHNPVINAQLGRRLFLPGLRLRYGFYRSQLGVGADYDFWKGGRLRTQYYDFEDPHVNAKFIFDTPLHIRGLVGVEDMFDAWDWTFGVQFGKDIP